MKARYEKGKITESYDNIRIHPNLNTALQIFDASKGKWKTKYSGMSPKKCKEFLEEFKEIGNYGKTNGTAEPTEPSNPPKPPETSPNPPESLVSTDSNELTDKDLENTNSNKSSGKKKKNR